MRVHVPSLAAAAAVGLFVTASQAAPIYADTLVASSNVTSFNSGNVTGAPDGGGLWLGSSSDPPAQLGTFTVSFASPLGNGAGADLVVVEIASSASETFNVEVSSDNLSYTLLGEFSATSNQIEFGSFGGPVNYVRLTNTSGTVSADIDALYGNFAASVPEPGIIALLGLGLAGLAATRRRKQ